MRIEEIIQKIGESLFEMRNDLTVDTELDTLEGWDSLGRLGLVVLSQEFFGRNLDTKALRECTTIGDIVNLVRPIAVVMTAKSEETG